MMVRPLEEKDYERVLEIADKLKTTDDRTGWFMEVARKKYIPFDIKITKGFVAEDEGEVIGFVTFTSYDYHPYIGWIGVDPDCHRKGAGRALVEAVKKEVKRCGGEELWVETPTREAGLGSDYETTYKFYTGVGFELDHVEEIGKDEQGNNCDMAHLKMVLK